MDCIRLFLEHYKIFFEVFSYTIVGIVGVIFSYYQYKSNKRQVEMQNMQMKMQQKESQPIFKILFYLVSHQETNDSEYLDIYNEGKPLTSFDYEIKTFFKLHYSSANGANNTYYVPISDYYLRGKITKNLTGKLLTKYLPNNHAKFYELYREAIEQSKNSNYIFINRFSLIKINYMDTYKNNQISYFQDDIEIDVSHYSDITEKSQQVFTFPFSINEVSLDSIKSHIESLKLPVI